MAEAQGAFYLAFIGGIIYFIAAVLWPNIFWDWLPNICQFAIAMPMVIFLLAIFASSK